MKFLRIEVKGWAGVESVTILNPPAGLIELWSQDIAQGKSSFQEPFLALAGGKARIVDGPSAVRRGHKRATARFEWEHEGETYRADLSVAKSGSLTVSLTAADGQPAKKPREVLSRFFGRLYSPADFRAWELKRQLEFARELAGPEWAARLTELQAAEAKAKQERHDLGQRRRAIGEPTPAPKVEPVDVAAIAEELRIAEIWNKDQDKKRALIAQEQGEIRANDAAIEELNRQIDELKRKRASRLSLRDTMLARLEEMVQPLPPRETAPLREQLEQASSVNAAAQRYQDYLAAEKRYRAAVEAHEQAELEVGRIAEQVAEHQRSAPLPAGLVVTDDGLEWQGRPLARASTGEGWRLAFELARLAGQHVLVADNAESMGATTIRQLDEWCREADMVAVLATLGRAHTPGALELRNGRLVGAEELSSEAEPETNEASGETPEPIGETKPAPEPEQTGFDAW